MPESDQSIGRKILGFFIKGDETGVPAAGTGSTGTTATGTPPAGSPGPVVPRPPTTVSAPAPVSPVPGTIDPKFAQHFADVLAQNNPAGPDYFEFRETLRMTKRNVQNLVQADEPTLFGFKIFILRARVNRFAVGVGNRVFISVGEFTPERETRQTGQIFNRRFQIVAHPARARAIQSIQHIRFISGFVVKEIWSLLKLWRRRQW